MEVDGVIIDNGNNVTYTHTGYSPNSEHTYRVRARNGDIVSEWSEMITRKTLTGVPMNITAVATSTQITVTWDPVVGATGYDIEVDGTVVDNGLNTTYVHTGLKPNTEHTYRVRARNEGGVSEWSEMVTARTILGIPKHIVASPAETSITLTWDPVEGATGYDIMVDGVVIDNGANTTYVHSGLEPNSTHIYRVRAKAGEYPGEWSDAVTCTTGLGIPANIRAVVTSTSITITWDPVAGATGYDIEVDGVVIDNGNSTKYVHSGLQPNTEHTYRVRAKNTDTVGPWSSLSEWSTSIVLVTAPGIPQNLRAVPEIHQITLLWDKSEGARSYDLEVDGKVVEGLRDLQYVHTGLDSNTRHIYRVRAKNDGGTSEWSEKLEVNTIPEISIDVGKDNAFNFVVVVPAKKDVTVRKVVVNYNPDELEVIDLCGATQQAELTAGEVAGTDVTVKEFGPGRIEMEIRSAGRTVMNTVKFIEKVNGISKVSYVVE